MASNSPVFETVIRAVDEMSAPVRQAVGSIRGLSGVTQVLGDHARGVGMVFKAAFGEAEHAGHAALGEIERSLHANTEGARRTGAELAHVARAAGGMNEAVKAVREVGAGLADIGRTASGVHETAKAVHSVNTELQHTAGDARIADHEMIRAARMHQWEALSGHISLLRTHFGNLGFGVGQFGSSLTTLLPVLGGLGVAGSLEGIFELVEQSSEAFSQMATAAQSIGVSVRQFQELKLAAGMADVSVDTLRTGMFRLGYTMQDVIAGRNKDVAGLFKQIHIDPHADIMKVMEQLSNAFMHTTDSKMRQKMAEALFGRGGESMIPFLAGGADQLKQFFALADRISFSPNKEQSEALERYHQSMVGLKAAVDGFQLAVGASLADAMGPALDKMRDWIAANRDWLTQDIAEKFKEFGEVLKKVDWKGIGDVFRKLAGDAGWLADHVGGAKGALEALVAIKAISWGAEWIHKFNQVALAVIGLSRAIKALDVAISQSTVGAAIAKMLPAATRVATGVGAGLYTFFDPTQITPESTERAALDQALKKMGLPPAVHQNVRQLSNIITPPGELPPSTSAAPWRQDYRHDPTAWELLNRPQNYLLRSSNAAPATVVAGSVDVNINLAGVSDPRAVQTRARGNVRVNVGDVGRAQSGMWDEDWLPGPE